MKKFFIVIIVIFLLNNYFLICQDSTIGHEDNNNTKIITIRASSIIIPERGSNSEALKQYDNILLKSYGCFFLSLTYIACFYNHHIEFLESDKFVDHMTSLLGTRYIGKDGSINDRNGAYITIFNKVLQYNNLMSERVKKILWPTDLYIGKLRGFSPYHFVVLKVIKTGKSYNYILEYDPYFSYDNYVNTVFQLFQLGD